MWWAHSRRVLFSPPWRPFSLKTLKINGGSENSQVRPASNFIYLFIFTWFWFSRTHSHPSPEIVTILTNVTRFRFEKASLLETCSHRKTDAKEKKKVTSRHLGSHGQDTDWRSDSWTWQKEMMAKQRPQRLTSDLILLARRAMLQVSWGCTDCRWGRSWGVYSLSFVSLVKVAFCEDQRTNVSTRAQVNRNKSQYMHRYFYNTFFLC